LWLHLQFASTVIELSKGRLDNNLVAT
jgi:hypothetical protein